MKFNPEILSNEPTHFDCRNKRFIKLFKNRTNVINRTTGEAEIMSGEHKGKWTTVNMDDLNSLLSYTFQNPSGAFFSIADTSYENASRRAGTLNASLFTITKL